MTATATATTFKKVAKRYSLNHYWKNPDYQAPTDPLQCLEYFMQHGEWSFAVAESNMFTEFYQCIVEYQKRRGVWADQHHTPPEAATFVARKAVEVFEAKKNLWQHTIQSSISVLDACAGFGSLTNALLKCGFMVDAFERDYALTKCAEILFEGHPGLCSFQCEDMEGYKAEPFHLIVANPPFSNDSGLVFLENARRWSAPGTNMLAILPNGYAYKTRPKRLVDELDKWEILNSWPLPGEFAHTKVRAEVVQFQLI